jgi:glycosyltransferase involved in cell wall biosynthesis
MANDKLTKLRQPRAEPAAKTQKRSAPGSDKFGVLIAAHSHPEFSKGGAEIAAHHLFSAFQSLPAFDPWFLGCAQANQKLGVTISQPFSAREYLYSVGAFDWFKFANRDLNFAREFRALLETLQPRVVHFHHYANFGVEAFLHVKRTLPGTAIVLTLHEYQAICNHFGQMITTEHLSLCYQASPIRCNGCFGNISRTDFFLRSLYIKRFFDLVDHFIAPSAFLAERYIAWGVPAERLSVIENFIPAPSVSREPEARAEDRPLRIGFFGQISRLKGMNVIFDAADIMEGEETGGIVFEIFGEYRNQPDDFQKEFLERLAKSGRNIIYQGPYDQNRVDQLMRSVDLVLIPSIWWENSPVVIQEALRNRKPIICSDIGGMAEKVRDGLDGFHFPVGNAFALTSLLRRLTAQRELLSRVVETMRVPPTMETTVEKHARLYEALAA